MNSPRVALRGKLRASNDERATVNSKTKLLILFAGLTFVTLALLAIDAEPSFLFGDSAVYLTTAVGKWIPPDRSFVYGLILRPLAVWPRSLEPVVFVQALGAVASSWLAGFVLVRYFGTSFAVAACCATACALEPLQLMLQRYVLPDSLGLCVFALFFLASLNYLKTASLAQLALVQILGVLLVSLRLTFLAVVIALAVLLPLFSRRARSFWRSVKRTRRVNWMRVTRFVALPLVFSLVVCQALLFGYRYLYGGMIGKPPAYLYRDGFFLLADFAPIVKPADYPVASTRDAIFANVKYPLGQRKLQRWARGGLCDEFVHDAGGDEDLANARARKTALNAVRRDPIGVLGLAAATYGDYFKPELVKDELLDEQGRGSALLPREKDMFYRVFNIDPTRCTFDSPTKRWESHATFWCWVVMGAPLLYGIYLVANHKVFGAAQAVLLACMFIMAIEVIVAVDHLVTRHLAPLAWLTIIAIGSTYRLRNITPKGGSLTVSE